MVVERVRLLLLCFTTVFMRTNASEADRSLLLNGKGKAAQLAAEKRIPLLGTGVNTDPQLQLLRLFHSLDVPVNNLVIVQGQRDPVVDMEIDYIVRNSPSGTRVTVLHYPGYLVKHFLRS